MTSIIAKYLSLCWKGYIAYFVITNSHRTEIKGVLPTADSRHEWHKNARSTLWHSRASSHNLHWVDTKCISILLYILKGNFLFIRVKEIEYGDSDKYLTNVQGYNIMHQGEHFFGNSTIYKINEGIFWRPL